MKRELYKTDIISYTQCEFKKVFSDVKCEHVTSKLSGFWNALYWNIATLGKVKAYVVYDGDKVIHYSYIVRGREKFVFLKDKDIEIGPCWTDPNYRGYGIYPAVLSLIVQKELSSGGSAFMIIANTNLSSQNGALKVGFKKTGYEIRKNIWKKHYVK